MVVVVVVVVCVCVCVCATLCTQACHHSPTGLMLNSLVCGCSWTLRVRVIGHEFGLDLASI